MNLKNSGNSTGFEPMTSAMPVQCSNQLSYKVTQWRAGQFVGLMFSRERNVASNTALHITLLSKSLMFMDWKKTTDVLVMHNINEKREATWLVFLRGIKPIVKQWSCPTKSLAIYCWALCCQYILLKCYAFLWNVKCIVVKYHELFKNSSKLMQWSWNLLLECRLCCCFLAALIPL